jgi:hypothetical protein
MKRMAVMALSLAMLPACSTTVSSSEVLSIDSSQNANPTSDFAVQRAWDLAYHWDCSSQLSEGTAGADGMRFTVINSDDDSLDGEHPSLDLKGRSGGATLSFRRGGTFHIHVVTPCDWRLTVDEAGT